MKVLSYMLLNKIKDITSAEELAQVLASELGFNCTYLTLEGKEKQLKYINASIAYEENNINSPYSSTQFVATSELTNEGYLSEEEFRYTYKQEDSTYTEDQLFLVRITDVYPIENKFIAPKDGQVTALDPMSYKVDNQQPISNEINRYQCYALEIATKRLLGDNYTQEEYYKNLKEIRSLETKIRPLSRQYRSTIHFTINSLVSEHDGGKWEQPYIFLEPMKPHFNDGNLEHIAPHDNIFSNEMQLQKPTLIIQKKHLLELLMQGDEDLLQTLLNTEIILLDDNCYEKHSRNDYVKYVLREMKHAPYYTINGKGASITEGGGLNATAKTVYKFAKELADERQIPYGELHDTSKQKKFDDFQMLKYDVEDLYRFLLFVRNNTKFNLSEQQKVIIDKALHDFHNICANSQLPLGFDQKNIPDPESKEFSLYCGLFNQLRNIIMQAIIDSQFYELVDLNILQEEIAKYNEDFKNSLSSSAEYNRARVFVHHDDEMEKD